MSDDLVDDAEGYEEEGVEATSPEVAEATRAGLAELRRRMARKTA